MPKDEETKGVQEPNDPKCNADVPPSLETMPTVVWDQSLSFLSPADMSTVSHRISKNLFQTIRSTNCESPPPA